MHKIVFNFKIMSVKSCQQIGIINVHSQPLTLEKVKVKLSLCFN
jgi:hypothetical protein